MMQRASMMGRQSQLCARQAMISARSSAAVRLMATSCGGKIEAPPMVYISGEEMTTYCMELIMAKWVEPYVDTSNWEFYNLSCRTRDDTEDQCLHDAVAAGARIGAIFKEPTVTPTEVQKEKLGLKKSWGSPNGAMRRGWNGITISRDTIHIEGMELGFKRPVFFERQAVGGEYAAGWKMTEGTGKVTTVFTPDSGAPPVIVDDRTITNQNGCVVTYDNPLDNVPDLAHHFFGRCLEADIVPYVVTKKTVFKWQEGFWMAMKEVFDADYKEKFAAKGLLDGCNGELQHLISDAATMQIIKWSDGGFGMAAHNYDGDMLTDEVAQVHRSPGFITSNLIGKAANGDMIKEYEASHGTVADMWEDHLNGKETSMNPLGMVEALIGAMQHSAHLAGGQDDVVEYTLMLRRLMHKAMVTGKGTRDLCGPSGLTTEEFVDYIASGIANGGTFPDEGESDAAVEPYQGDVDMESIEKMFKSLDSNGDGVISLDEFATGLRKLNAHPRQFGFE